MAAGWAPVRITTKGCYNVLEQCRVGGRSVAMKKWNVFVPVAPLGVSRRKSRAFTLVELLVVIAIIVLLIAMFIPEMSRLISRGRTVQCASNLKRIGEAAQGRKVDDTEEFDLMEGL